MLWKGKNPTQQKSLQQANALPKCERALSDVDMHNPIYFCSPQPHKKLFFCTFHDLFFILNPTYLPGFFCLAVRSSMPDFYEKMKNRLRTAEQGADTAVWLAMSPAAGKLPSGLFFQGIIIMSMHLTALENTKLAINQGLTNVL